LKGRNIRFFKTEWAHMRMTRKLPNAGIPIRSWADDEKMQRYNPIIAAS
jgi:hypothetical protein